MSFLNHLTEKTKTVIMNILIYFKEFYRALWKEKKARKDSDT